MVSSGVSAPAATVRSTAPALVAGAGAVPAAGASQPSMPTHGIHPCTSSASKGRIGWTRRMAIVAASKASAPSTRTPAAWQSGPAGLPGFPRSWSAERVVRDQLPPVITACHGIGAVVGPVAAITIVGNRAIVGRRGPMRGAVSDARARNRSMIEPGGPPAGVTWPGMPNTGLGAIERIVAGSSPSRSGLANGSAAGAGWRGSDGEAEVAEDPPRPVGQRDDEVEHEQLVERQRRAGRQRGRVGEEDREGAAVVDDGRRSVAANERGLVDGDRRDHDEAAGVGTHVGADREGTAGEAERDVLRAAPVGRDRRHIDGRRRRTRRRPGPVRRRVGRGPERRCGRDADPGLEDRRDAVDEPGPDVDEVAEHPAGGTERVDAVDQVVDVDAVAHDRAEVVGELLVGGLDALHGRSAAVADQVPRQVDGDDAQELAGQVPRSAPAGSAA